MGYCYFCWRFRVVIIYFLLDCLCFISRIFTVFFLIEGKLLFKILCSRLLKISNISQLLKSCWLPWLSRIVDNSLKWMIFIFANWCNQWKWLSVTRWWRNIAWVLEYLLLINFKGRSLIFIRILSTYYFPVCCNFLVECCLEAIVFINIRIMNFYCFNRYCLLIYCMNFYWILSHVLRK